MGNEFAAVQAIWLREFKVFQREKSRVISSVASPLFWLVLFGAGFGGRVTGCARARSHFGIDSAECMCFGVDRSGGTELGTSGGFQYQPDGCAI